MQELGLGQVDAFWEWADLLGLGLVQELALVLAGVFQGLLREFQGQVLALGLAQGREDVCQWLHRTVDLEGFTNRNTTTCLAVNTLQTKEPLSCGPLQKSQLQLYWSSLKLLWMQQQTQEAASHGGRKHWEKLRDNWNRHCGRFSHDLHFQDQQVLISSNDYFAYCTTLQRHFYLDVHQVCSTWIWYAMTSANILHLITIHWFYLCPTARTWDLPWWWPWQGVLNDC